MLVVTRREGEEVIVGDPANPLGIVRIASVKGERVRIAFEFPREIEVHRREIADLIICGKPDIAGTIRPNMNAKEPDAGEAPPQDLREQGA